MNGRSVIVIVAVLLVVALLIAAALRPGRFVNSAKLAELEQKIAHILVSRGELVRAVYVAGFVVLGVLGLPVVTALIPVGGYLFGWGEGVLWGMVGSVLTALASYAMARFWLGRWLRRRYTPRQRWLRMEIQRHGASYLLILRLLLAVPFVWINSIAGLTSMPLGHYLWTLVAGTLPVCALYAYAGAKLRHVQSLQDILTPQIVTAFVVMAALVAFRLVMEKRRRLRYSRTAVTR